MLQKDVPQKTTTMSSEKSQPKDKTFKVLNPHDKMLEVSIPTRTTMSPRSFRPIREKKDFVKLRKK